MARVTSIENARADKFSKNEKVLSSEDIQPSTSEEQIERVHTHEQIHHYDNEEEEPEIHIRTWIAFSSMLLLGFVQFLALGSPPAVSPYIIRSFPNANGASWVSGVLPFVSAVIGPVISLASDVYQARKSVLVGGCILATVGAGIAPGSKTLGRLIAAQTLIGVGFATMPLGYAVPAEILPRKWRPSESLFFFRNDVTSTNFLTRKVGAACVNIAAALGAIVGPLVIGAQAKADEVNGWRDFFWIEFALWAATAIGITAGYRPPKRHSRLDHLSLSGKLKALDLPGSALLTLGLSLFLTGLTLGSGMYPWTNVRTLSTIIVGLAVLIGFGLYEWKGTKTGILHHELFTGGKSEGRTFIICLLLFFTEGLVFFAYVVGNPLMNALLFTADPFITAARGVPFYIAASIAITMFGYFSTRYRTIREPLFVGFLIATAGIASFATIQPGQGFNQLAFSALSGVGFGAPFLIITAVQLATPHHLIATATAATVSARAVGSTIFVAIYIAAYTDKITVKLPTYVASAAVSAGLPPDSVPAFIGALTHASALPIDSVPGVTPSIIALGSEALKSAYADSLRVMFIIAAPFGVVACVCSLWIGDLRKTMNYKVDAPVEELHAKHRRNENDA